jgi:methylphosphotriester-DNA--protein-cysteine methyltransferase
MRSLPTIHVKNYIASHLPAIRTIQDVARELGVSAQTLRKDFVRSERISLREYIEARRIESMQDLLKRTDLPCMDICRELGCREDVGERFFKRQTGMTMQQFRSIARRAENLQGSASMSDEERD